MVKNNYGIGGRLREFRDESNLKILEFSKILGISHGYLSEVEQGKKQVGLDLIMSLKRNFPLLESEWLLTGEGEMFRKRTVGRIEPPKEPSSPAESDKIKQLEEKVNYLYKVVSERPAEFQPLYKHSSGAQIPFYAYSVAAGKPDLPPDDHHEYLQIDSKLLKRPKNAFALRVSGESMVGAGIQDGDIIVVDRVSEPLVGAIIVANIGSEGYTVKILEKRKNGDFWLKPSNPKFKAVKITPEMQASIIGRVVLIIRQT
jgi:DNA polymerase V